MSFIFDQLPTAIYPAPTGEPKAKDVLCKAVKLTFADFTTGGAASLKAYMPADASIVKVTLWTKTTFAGNGVSALSLQIGVTGTAAKYLAASTVQLTGPSTITLPSGVANNLFGVFDPTAPGGDVPLLFTGTATTGNPTSGEAYVLIEYVR
jgi:hypothetical protein